MAFKYNGLVKVETPSFCHFRRKQESGLFNNLRRFYALVFNCVTTFYEFIRYKICRIVNKPIDGTSIYEERSVIFDGNCG